LVAKAEDWQWSSLYKRQRNNKEDKKLVAILPTELAANYLESVNTILKDKDLEYVRHSITKGTPYGDADWVRDMVDKYDLTSTMRGPGRPKRN
jgi:putative transposase